MGKPFSFGVTVPKAVGPYSPAAQKENEATASGFAPPTIASSWDVYRTVLGVTVPHNVNRAKAATAALIRNAS